MYRVLNCCQVMHRVPGVRSISEAYGMLHLHYLYIQRIIGIDGYKKLLKSYFRILCKKEHEKVVFKLNFNP